MEKLNDIKLSYWILDLFGLWENKKLKMLGKKKHPTNRLSFNLPIQSP
jgi:hypothetical protein